MWVKWPRVRRISGLAMPIIGGFASNNVLTLVDTAMVGTLGNAALAAVGLGAFAAFMCQALLMGISAGTQATVARRKGEGRSSEAGSVLNAALLVVMIAAIPASMVLYQLVPRVFSFLSQDPDVVAAGVPYLQIQVAVIGLLGMRFAFRGFWAALDMTRVYMVALLIMHASNILLNYLLIFGKFGLPALGVVGASIGTALASLIGLVAHFVLAWRYARPYGFLRGLPDLSKIKRLVSLSLPASLKELLFASGFTIMFWIIGQIGTAELAAANVLINITLVAIFCGDALGIAAMTLVGQALGRGDVKDAYRWGWDTVKVGVTCFGILGIPMWLFPDQVLGIFLNDPATLELARNPLRFVGVLIAIDAVGIILMHALLGAGDVQRVLLAAVLPQWLLFLPLAYLAGPVLGHGLLVIWFLLGGYRILQVFIFSSMWRGGRWEAQTV